MPLQGTASPIAGGGTASMYKSLSDRTRAAQAKRNDIGMCLAPSAIPISNTTGGGSFAIPGMPTLMVNIPAGCDYMMLQSGGFYQSTTSTINDIFMWQFYFVSSPPYGIAEGDLSFFQIPCTYQPIVYNGTEGLRGAIFGLVPGWYEVSLFGYVEGSTTGTLYNAWFMAWSPAPNVPLPSDVFILGSATNGVLGTNVLG